MTAEINGDARLGVVDRLRYLGGNLLRNLPNGRRPSFARFAAWNPAPAVVRDVADSGASPGRCLAEAFLVHELPRLLSPGPIEVLEIGCGSGRARHLLARAGYSGRYTGLDVRDRFDTSDTKSGFVSTFRLLDAHEIEHGARFDLILSNSALEHIADDNRLVSRLRECLRPGGLQLHVVPTGVGLLAYLWHGYRQYNAAALARRFDPAQTWVYRLGGLASLLVHLAWITGPEMLFRFRPRERWPNAYGACLRAAFRCDRAISFGAPMYAVAETRPEAG